MSQFTKFVGKKDMSATRKRQIAKPDTNTHKQKHYRSVIDSEASSSQEESLSAEAIRIAELETQIHKIKAATKLSVKEYKKLEQQCAVFSVKYQQLKENAAKLRGGIAEGLKKYAELQQKNGIASESVPNEEAKVDVSPSPRTSRSVVSPPLPMTPPSASMMGLSGPNAAASRVLTASPQLSALLKVVEDAQTQRIAVLETELQAAKMHQATVEQDYAELDKYAAELESKGPLLAKEFSRLNEEFTSITRRNKDLAFKMLLATIPKNPELALDKICRGITVRSKTGVGSGAAFFTPQSAVAEVAVSIIASQATPAKGL